MQWNRMDKQSEYAMGEDATYVVTRGQTEVRLTRFSHGILLNAVVEAARNVIVLPLGRGPGRPGGGPELAALVSSAKVFAEGFEAGESLADYPHWRHGDGTFVVREGDFVRFIDQGDLPDFYQHDRSS